MQKIIPLRYKIKLWKSCLSEDKIKKYSTPEYFKERLEDEFKVSEHLKDSKKFFIKRYEQKDISLEDNIEIDNFNDTIFIFSKFKYWDKIAKHDNWKIVEDWEIIQEIVDKGSLLTDFYFWMEFNVIIDSKFLILEWVITIIKKSSEQMKAQILKLFEKDIYIQDNFDFKPEYFLDFKFEEEEIENITEKVKWLELITELKRESEWDQAESWSEFKNIPIKIIIWWWFQDKAFNGLKNILWNLTWFKVSEIKKRAIVKQGKSILRSNFFNDNLKLSLKESFLYSDESIEYDKFKNETYKYIFPNIDFED